MINPPNRDNRNGTKHRPLLDYRSAMDILDFFSRHLSHYRKQLSAHFQ